MKGLVRFLFFTLMIVAAQKAWAGVWLHAGARAYQENRFDAAAGALEKAGDGPAAMLLLGKSLYHEGVKTGDAEKLGRAESVFEEMNTAWSFYGRAWIYRALSAHAHLKSRGKVSRAACSRIKYWLIRGVQSEPGSAWAHFVAARELLACGPLLGAENKMVLNWLQKAAEFSPPAGHRRAKFDYRKAAGELTGQYFGKSSL